MLKRGKRSHNGCFPFKRGWSIIINSSYQRTASRPKTHNFLKKSKKSKKSKQKRIMFCTKMLSKEYLRKYSLREVGWLVGCFGLNGPLRQYFSLYRAVSQREGERKEK